MRAYDKSTSKEYENLKKFKKEIKRLKEEYKKCMEAVKIETYERNKAETISKVLKDTLEAQRDLENSENASANNNKEEEMIIDDESGVWTHVTNGKNCKGNMEESSDNRRIVYDCEQCKVNFVTKKKFKEHLQIHNESLTKEKSDKVNIEETADKAKQFYNCQK